MNNRMATFYCWVLFIPFFSAMGEGITELNASFENSLARADASAELNWVQIGRSYEQALERMFDVARSEGNLDFVTAVRSEQQRFSSHRRPPESFSEFPRLQQLQLRLQQEYHRIQPARAREVLQHADELDRQLDALQRRQVIQGEIDMAMRTRSERQTIQEREAVRQARDLVAVTMPERSEPVRAEPRVRQAPPPEAKFFFGRHFLLVREDLPWQQARERAEAMGGRLARIPNRRVNDFIRDEIQVPDRHFVWVGATNEGTDGNWEWIGGMAFRFTNWAPGEPNNWNGNEHHLAIRQDGLWNDMNAGTPTWFICEWGP